MRLGDIPQVMEVERESFPTMWPPTAFKRELQQNRLAHYGVVVEHRLHAEEPQQTEAVGPGKHSGGLGRIFGELRHILGTDGEERHLPPPEQRLELVLGFIGVWLLPDETHIVTVAVRGSHRRRGLGELLLVSAIELSQENGQGLITLECRVSNEPALALYEKYGFQQVGLRPRYYSDNHEDAYILTVSSIITQRYQEMFEERRAAHRGRWGDFNIDLG